MSTLELLFEEDLSIIPTLLLLKLGTGFQGQLRVDFYYDNAQAGTIFFMI